MKIPKIISALFAVFSQRGNRTTSDEQAFISIRDKVTKEIQNLTRMAEEDDDPQNLNELRKLFEEFFPLAADSPFRKGRTLRIDTEKAYDIWYRLQAVSGSMTLRWASEV